MASKRKCLIETLKSEIISGKYDSARVFPSERALASRFKLSRPTIRQAMQELCAAGLVHRRQGRGTFVTRTGNSRKIGLLLSGMTYSEYFQPIATAFMHIALATGYELHFHAVKSQDPTERICEVRDIANDFIRKQVSGVLYHPLDYAFDEGAANRQILAVLKGARIPVVLFDSDVEVAPCRSAYDLVSIDNVLAGETVGRHLLEQGARNIHFLLKPNWIPNAKMRIRGVACAVMAKDGCWNASNVLISSPDDEKRICAHFHKHPRPDAFVCENDNLAAIFMKTLDKIGIRVPRDLLLAGFDDVNIARLLTPQLTSIHQPCEQIAEAAFGRLLARIDNPELPAQEIFVYAPLHARASTSPRKE